MDIENLSFPLLIFLLIYNPLVLGGLAAKIKQDKKFVVDTYGKLKCKTSTRIGLYVFMIQLL